MTQSSGTQERWEIPDTCPRCSAVGSVEISEFDKGQRSARLRCLECMRAWWIEPTPIYEVADRNARELEQLRALRDLILISHCGECSWGSVVRAAEAVTGDT